MDLQISLIRVAVVSASLCLSFPALGQEIKIATESDVNAEAFKDGNFSTGFMRLNLQPVGCNTKRIAIHEFMHALGVWHEQSREDRNTYVTINYQNIKAGKEHNFNQHITDGSDIGSYDYSSIMHYGAYAFTSNNQKTIETIPSGISIGQRLEMSAGDIASIEYLYPSPPPPPFSPATIIPIYYLLLLEEG